MSDRGNDAREEYRRELAFLEERLRAVEREIRARCASLVESYSEVQEGVRRECRRPFGEEEPPKDSKTQVAERPRVESRPDGNAGK